MYDFIAASCSAGKPAYEHDLRKNYTKTADKDLSNDNVVLVDEVKGRSVRDYINELMQPAIDEYNAKQKRKDRKIDKPYSEWHTGQKNKGDLIYEYVLQFGEGNDLGQRYYAAVKAAALDPTNEELQKTKENLKQEFVDVYTQWNDYLKELGFTIAWSVIHFDEGFRTLKDGTEICGTPHLHAGILPIPKQEFQRGPKTQISMAKVLEENGFDRLINRSDAKQPLDKVLYQQGRFFAAFREYQNQTLQERGYQIKAPQAPRKHMNVEVFISTKQAEKLLEELQLEVNAAQCELDTAKNALITAKNDLDKQNHISNNLTAQIGVLEQQKTDVLQAIDQLKQKGQSVLKMYNQNVEYYNKSRDEMQSVLEEFDVLYVEYQKKIAGLKELNKKIEIMSRSTTGHHVTRLKENPPKTNMFGKEIQPGTTLVITEDLDKLENQKSIMPINKYDLSEVNRTLEDVKNIIGGSKLEQLHKQVIELEEEVRAADIKNEKLRNENRSIKDWVIDIVKDVLYKEPTIDDHILGQVEWKIQHMLDDLDRAIKAQESQKQDQEP